MSRNVTVSCDYCTDSITEHEEDELMDWISVDLYDTLREEQRELDFCSNECVVSYFT